MVKTLFISANGIKGTCQNRTLCEHNLKNHDKRAKRNFGHTWEPKYV